MKHAIRIDHVSKVHEGKKIVSAMNLEIRQETVVGIISDEYEKVNIMMQLLSGELMPCSGEIYYGEERLGLYGQTPEYVGVYINDIGFIKEFNGYKNLKYIAGMNERASEKEIIEAMTFVGLNTNSRLKVSQYSKRMLKKLGIAQAIMEGQDLLLLDAGMFTTESIDDHMEISKIIRKLKKIGFTLIIASEKEEYVKDICDEIILI